MNAKTRNKLNKPGGIFERHARVEAERDGKAAAAVEASGQAEPWDEPIPLDDAAELVDPFPLDVLPDWLAELCVRIGKAVPCPVDYPATYALAIAAGTVGGSMALKIKSGWDERCVLYACVVARPNDGKTPAMDPLLTPVIDEHAKRIAAEDANKHPAYVSDVTVESLAPILQDNPRGLLLARDELTAWVMSMDQYKTKGSGADRQFWLSNWSSTSINVRRKDPARPAVFVRRPCITVTGGIQPAVLDRFRGNDDGFFDRMLFAYPAPLPAAPENWDCIDESELQEWSFVLEKLRDRKLIEGEHGHQRPWFVKMSDDARAEWQSFTKWRAERLNDPDLPEPLRGPIGKLANYAARLALVIFALRTYDYALNDLPRLTGADMAAGAKLARYFESHGRKVFAVMGRDTRIELARRVLNWIKGRKTATFKPTDAYQALRSKLLTRPEQVYKPLRLLAQLGYVREVPTPYAGIGKKPDPTYLINPLLEKMAQDTQ